MRAIAFGAAAAKEKYLRRGVKEVVKSIRKGETGCVRARARQGCMRIKPRCADVLCGPAPLPPLQAVHYCGRHFSH